MSQSARCPSDSRSVDIDESEIDLYTVVEGRVRSKPSRSSLQDYDDKSDCVKVSELERKLRVISKRTDKRNRKSIQETTQIEGLRESTRTTTSTCSTTGIRRSNSTQQRQRSNNIQNSVHKVKEHSLSSFRTVPASQQKETHEERQHCLSSNFGMAEAIQQSLQIQHPRKSILTSQSNSERKISDIQTASNNDEMERKYPSRRPDASRRLASASITAASGSFKTVDNGQSNNDQEKSNYIVDSKRTSSRLSFFPSWQRPSLRISKELTEEHKKAAKERAYIDSLFS